MKIIKKVNLPNSRMRVIVELDKGEEVGVGVKPDAYYKLGEPMHEDVFPGHMLVNLTQTTWCPIEQKWV